MTQILTNIIRSRIVKSKELNVKKSVARLGVEQVYTQHLGGCGRMTRVTDQTGLH
jgi:hypothetical protein